MKRFTLILTFSLIALLSFAQFPMLEIGDIAPQSDLKMKDISGEMISLDDVKKQNGLLVIFSCNSCPFVIAWEDRYPELKDLSDDNKVGMIVINSNAAKRSGADSFDAMKRHAKEKGYNMSYVVDENSTLANAFGAKTTPHVFLFDDEKKLVYMGSIDDNHKSKSKVEAHWLADAIKNLGKKEKIDPSVTRATGCSIKR